MTDAEFDAAVDAHTLALSLGYVDEEAHMDALLQRSLDRLQEA